MRAASELATKTIGVDPSWVVVPVVVLVIVLVAISARRASRDGGGAGGAMEEVARAAPHAVLSVIGTMLVAVGGGTATVTVGLLPVFVIVEALGAHVLGPLLIVLAVAVATLLLGAVLLGRGLRELWPLRRGGRPKRG